MLLNPEKSEVLLVARKAVADKFSNGSGVAVAGSNITFSVKLKSLRVTIDQTLSFDQHVRDVVKASNFHMKALRHIRPVLNRTVANTIAYSIVTTRLDYCNSLLYGTSAANIARLQRVQNNLAWIVTGAKRRDHITPVLRDPVSAASLEPNRIQGRSDHTQDLASETATVPLRTGPCLQANTNPSLFRSASSRDRLDSRPSLERDHSAMPLRQPGTDFLQIYEW